MKQRVTRKVYSLLCCVISVQYALTPPSPHTHTHTPDRPVFCVADEQGLGGRRHARGVEEALPKIVFGEREVEAGGHATAAHQKGKHWAVLHLKVSGGEGEGGRERQTETETKSSVTSCFVSILTNKLLLWWQ